MRFVSESPRAQASYGAIKGLFSDKELIVDRIEELAENGLISFDGKSYFLAVRGIGISNFFKFYRKLLGRGIGG